MGVSGFDLELFFISESENAIEILILIEKSAIEILKSGREKTVHEKTLDLIKSHLDQYRGVIF